MKLLYITNGINGSGGLERVLSIKASYFADKFNYDVNILTLNNGDKDIFFDFSEKIKFHDIIVKGSKPFKFFNSYKNGIKNTINKINPDIILVCDDGLKGLMFPILFGKDIPIIYERHVSKNVELQKNKNDFLSKTMNKIKFIFMDYIANKFDKFVVLTEGNTKEWNINNLKIIPNPMPFNSSKITDINNKRIIAVGKQSYQKSYDRLIDIWDIISKKHPNWELDIYGKLDSSLKLEDKAKSLNLENSLKFYPPTKNIEDKYLESSIYVMTSRYEGFGMVLIEAMNFGLPCISFNCPHGPADIISDNEDGFLVNNGDIEEFAKKLSLLIENNELREKMAKNAIKNVKKYDIDNIAIKWENLFKELVNK